MWSRQIFFAGCATLALSGCKDELSDITDAQLLDLLASEGTASPRQILMETRECVELLGGINDAALKYLPENLLDRIKDGCRIQIRHRLEDRTRNTTDLALEDFERSDLAERIIALARAQEAAWMASRRVHQTFTSLR